MPLVLPRDFGVTIDRRPLPPDHLPQPAFHLRHEAAVENGCHCLCKDDQNGDVGTPMSLEESIRDTESENFFERLGGPVEVEDLFPKISKLVVDAVE